MTIIAETAEIGEVDLGRRPGRWIAHWAPEDAGFWRAVGSRIARRNLIFSIFAEHIGFSVWLLWSIVVVRLGDVGWQLTTSQKLWLTAVPSGVGALLRLPYTFAVRLRRPELDDRRGCAGRDLLDRRLRRLPRPDLLRLGEVDLRRDPAGPPVLRRLLRAAARGHLGRVRPAGITDGAGRGVIRTIVGAGACWVTPF